MITNYVGSNNTEHRVTEYTLSTGKVVTLTEDEADELCVYIDQNKYANQVEALECEVESLDHENEDLRKQIKELQEELLKLK